jgi:cell wall-associated NlpC family hydrolase
MGLKHLVVAFALSGLFLMPHSATADQEPTSPAQIAVEAWQVWNDASTPINYVRFVQSRSEALQGVADQLGIDHTDLLSAWSSAPVVAQVATLAAIGQLGNDYTFASSDPDKGLDCSGLTRFAYAQVGIEIPRVSRTQIQATIMEIGEGGEEVESESFQTGDLLYYPGHIMIALGFEDYVVHSANERTGVVLGTVRRRVSQGRPASAHLPETPTS